MATGDIIKSENYNNTEEYLGRLKLVQMSIENPDMIYAYFSGTYHKWVEKVLPQDKVPYMKNTTYVDHCAVTDFKY